MTSAIGSRLARVEIMNVFRIPALALSTPHLSQRRSIRPEETFPAQPGEYAHHTRCAVENPKYGIEPDFRGGLGHQGRICARGEYLWNGRQRPTSTT